MKAVVHRRYGPPDVLRLAEVETPEPKNDEVLIRVRAAEATKSDCELRSFRFPVKWHWLPLRLVLGVFRPRRPILGAYFAGEVAAVGPSVTGLAPGDAVYGSLQLRFGAYAEFVCAPASYTIVPKPSNLTFEQAAAVPLGGLNALHFLRRAELRAGERVLVNGAGGSIGSFAVQLARAMGAEVTAVDAAHKERSLRRLGADHFIDYAVTDFAAEGESYDVIFNMVAGRAFSSCMVALAPGGRYLTANPKFSDMLRAAWPWRAGGRKAIFAFARETPEELRELTSMIERGVLTPEVDRVYPMAEAAEAHRRVEAERRRGSVVLSIR
jgi:NADPH:quinone reductase-like Zn-dependent oxidoreductase